VYVISEFEILKRRWERIRLSGFDSGSTIKVQRVDIVPWAGLGQCAFNKGVHQGKSLRRNQRRS